VIYSEEYPRRSLLMQTYTGSLSIGNLPPGTYQVVAVKDARDLEFRNPAAMEKYLKHADVVTLGPGGKATMRNCVYRFENPESLEPTQGWDPDRKPASGGVGHRWDRKS